jgi:hypothetical protein
LLALTQGKANCVDYWPSFYAGNMPDEEAALFEREFAKPDVVFIVHAPGAEVFPRMRIPTKSATHSD